METSQGWLCIHKLYSMWIKFTICLCLISSQYSPVIYAKTDAPKYNPKNLDRKLHVKENRGVFTLSRINASTHGMSNDRRGYWKFYCSAETSPVNFDSIKSVYDDKYIKHTEQFEHKKTKETEEDVTEVPEAEKLMDVLWNIIHIRKPGSVTAHPERHHPRRASSFLVPLEHEVSAGVVVELGTAAALALARKNTDSTYIMVALDESLLSVAEEAVARLSLSNIYLGYLEEDELMDTVATLAEDPQVLLGNLLLNDLASMVGSLLPHEFEELLARLLSLATKTLLTTLGMEGSGQLPFFSRNWPHPGVLLEKSCAVAGLTCDIWVVQGEGWMGSVLTIYAVHVTVGRRLLTQQFCNAIVPDSRCEFQYGDTSELAEILFSDKSRHPAPVLEGSLTLDSLLQLGCQLPCRELVFSKALALTYRSPHSRHVLMLRGSEVFYYKHQTSTIFPQLLAEKRQMADVKVARSPRSKTHIEEDPVADDLVMEEDALHFKPHNSVTIQAQTVSATTLGGHSENLPSGSPASSQLDGVAGQWARVDGEDPAPHREHQRVVHMQQVWDREDPQHPQAKSKESATLERLGRTWEREQTAHKEGAARPSVAGKEGQGHQRSSAKKYKDDTILRHDEKQLVQAMGFLHGNSKMGGAEMAGHEKLDSKSRREFIRKLSSKLRKHVGKGSEGNSVVQTPNQSTSTKANMIIRNIMDGGADTLATAVSSSPSTTSHSRDDAILQPQLEEQPDNPGFNKMEEEFSYDVDPEDEPAPIPQRFHDVIFAQSHFQNGDDTDLAEMGDHDQDADYNYDDDDDDPDNEDVIISQNPSSSPAGKSSNADAIGPSDLDQPAPLPQLPAQESNPVVQLSDVDAGNLLQDGQVDEAPVLPESILPEDKDADRRMENPLEEELEDKEDPLEAEEGQLIWDSIHPARNILQHRPATRRRLLAAEMNPNKLHVSKKDRFRVYKKYPESQKPLPDDSDTGNQSLDKMKMSEAETAENQPNMTSPDNPQVSVHQMSSFRALFKHQRKYDHQWHQLQWEFSKAPPDASIMVYGGRALGLLGLKLARKYPEASVLIVVPSYHHGAVESLRQLGLSMELKQIMLLVQTLDVATVHQLYTTQEIREYQVLSCEVFTSLLDLGPGFLLHLGQLLTLARTTILEVPDPLQLQHLQAKLASQGYGQALGMDIQGLIPLALHQVGGHAMVTLIKDTEGHMPLKLVKVTLTHLVKQVSVDCDEGVGQLQLSSSGEVNLVGADGLQGPLVSAGRTFSLQTLINLGLHRAPKESRLLFLLYFEVPVHEDMCPLHIHWYSGALMYHVATGQELLPTGHTARHRQQQAQDLASTLDSLLEDEPFSFVDYGSWRGAVTLTLAAKHPNCTFLAMVDSDPAQSLDLYSRVKEAELHHVAVVNVTLEDTVTSKLVESPEFFRYQLIDWYMLVKLLATLDLRNQLHFMLGQILATGITTFIQTPTDKSLSLAMSTLYPNLYHGLPIEDFHQLPVHHSSSHPLPMYQDAETRLIGQVARAHVNVSIRSEVIRPDDDLDTEHPWAVLRVDINSVNATVHHHFDYQLDGHARQYVLHASSWNHTHHDVYLIREMDGFKIPYGQVQAISLIALLRLGLVAAMKETLYEQFLKLPYYEDMAPWNIVFQGGYLRYIDYDTKDVQFNKMVPAAYQVMYMLLNYERTIQDFGHCGPHGRVAIGLSYLDLVTRCVGGGGMDPRQCTDSRYPVACGDMTCRSTYIECLQALQQLEINRTQKQQQMLADLRSGYNSQLVDENRLFQEGSWSFGIEGPIKSAEPHTKL